jgi:hypothetical protein
MAADKITSLYKHRNHKHRLLRGILGRKSRRFSEVGGCNVVDYFIYAAIDVDFELG